MPKTILVVDDDVSIVNMIKEDLEYEGYAVICGYDGQMAVHLARTQKPHLIILDVNMPMTSGLKAMEFLRSTEETKTIPIIFLTGEESARVYPVIESAQRVAHVKKPLDLENLNTMVREFLTKYPRF